MAAERVIYDDFVSLIQAVVLPLRVAHPDHLRLDGAPSGGNWQVTGRFRYNGQIYSVYADSHYQPLELAYTDATAGTDPFTEEETSKGGRRCLVLRADLKSRRHSPYKHLNIYRD